MYHVYILKCSDNTLYTGMAKIVGKRVEEHNSSEKGAKYTRGRRPVVLAYSAGFATRSAALKEEYRIKKLSKKDKLKIIESG